jgi:hypothetical protein
MLLVSNAMLTAKIALETPQHALLATQIHTCIKVSVIHPALMKHTLMLQPRLANHATTTVLYAVLHPLIALFAIAQDYIFPT